MAKAKKATELIGEQALAAAIEHGRPPIGDPPQDGGEPQPTEEDPGKEPEEEEAAAPPEPKREPRWYTDDFGNRQTIW